MRVKVQPRARRPGLLGLAPSADGPRLRLAVTAPAEHGKANAAVCALLAEVLGVATSAVTEVQGAASRDKTLAVAGDPHGLGARLETFA